MSQQETESAVLAIVKNLSEYHNAATDNGKDYFVFNTLVCKNNDQRTKKSQVIYLWCQDTTTKYRIKQVVRFKNHLTSNLLCLHKKVLPVGLNIKSPVNATRAKSLMWKVGFRLLCESIATIHHTHTHTLDRIVSESERIEVNLSNIL